MDPALVTWHGSAAAPATRALEGGLAWVATSPRRFTYERLQPSYSSLYPYLQVAGRSTWAEVGRGYLELLAERLPPPEEVQELAARLVREEQDPAARVDALADHVRRLLTYKAIEFGIRGRVPHPSTKTLERRYGDCKDHALLLYQLLRAADVRAHLVLVDVDDPVVPELPTLDAFDHMVVYVPDVRGGLLVDTTDKNLATALTPVPYGLSGEVELVGAEASAFDAHEGGALLEYEARLQPTPTGSRLTYRIQRAAGRWESSRWQALVEAQRAALDRLRARFRASAD